MCGSVCARRKTHTHERERERESTHTTLEDRKEDLVVIMDMVEFGKSEGKKSEVKRGHPVFVWSFQKFTGWLARVNGACTPSFRSGG